MAAQALTTEIDNSHDWKIRSELWARRSGGTPKPPKGQRRKEPLVLCGHGAALKIEAGSLLVRNGFTHHPQAREEFRFFPGSLDIPSQIIMLDGSGHLTFDVLGWLAEQSVTLSRITWQGNVANVLGASGYSANPYRAEWQRETRADHAKRMAWCIDLIAQKIEGCIRTLEKVVPRSQAWEAAMTRAYSDLSALELNPPQTIVDLRIIEANSAAAYFRAWRDMPAKWRGTSRNPIPDDWRNVGSRTSAFALAGNRNASHPVNAMLNYAYAVLESRMRIKAMIDGYDPTIGIMHEGGNGASAFIFDIMEPERSAVDLAMLRFIKSMVFQPGDFVLRADGVVRVNPQLARTIAGLV
jgi:CRISPR-associated protein Cas1